MLLKESGFEDEIYSTSFLGNDFVNFGQDFLQVNIDEILDIYQVYWQCVFDS